MYKMKLSGILLAALALASCERVDGYIFGDNPPTYPSYPPPPEESHPSDKTSILFSAENAVTKTGGCVHNSNEISNFTVAANTPHPQFPGDEIQDDGGFNCFGKIDVVGYLDEWRPARNVSWPEGNDTLGFYAYTPAVSVNVDSFFYYQGNPEYPFAGAYIDYTVTPGYPYGGQAGEKIPDNFRVAVKRQTRGQGQCVKLEFSPALSAVYIAASNVSTDTIQIEKAQLINLYNQGRLYLAPDFPQGESGWKDQRHPCDYNIGIPLQSDGSNAATLYPRNRPLWIAISSPSSPLFVLPQELKASPITEAFALKAGEAEPSAPGILLSYTVKDSTGEKPYRVYYPFPKTYTEGHSTLAGYFEQVVPIDPFSFQMGMYYEFAFAFEDSGLPKLSLHYRTWEF
jgi:hypothetical protein